MEKQKKQAITDCDPLDAPWQLFPNWIELFRNAPEKMPYLMDAIIRARFGEDLKGEDIFLDTLAKDYAEVIRQNQIKYLSTKRNKSASAQEREKKKKEQKTPQSDHSVPQSDHGVPHSATQCHAVTTECHGVPHNYNYNYDYNDNCISSDEDIKEESISEDIDKKKTSSRFIPPTLDEVAEYCVEKHYNIDPERFFNYYESKGWMVGKNKMTKWKSALANWVKTEKEKGYNHQPIKVEEPTPPQFDIMQFVKVGRGGEE